MRIYLPALILALLASQANSEPMPWETEEYFESKRRAQQEHLSKFPIEMMLLLGVDSKPDGSPTGWIRLGEEHPFPLDPRVNIASVFNVSSGMKIGLNEGIIKDVFDYGIVIEEKIPVCGESGFIKRTTLLEIKKPMPEGTTVKYSVVDGMNEC